MGKSRISGYACLATALVLLIVSARGSSAFAMETEQAEAGQFRRDEVERKLPTLAAAHHAAQADEDARRAYADGLFKLGDIWRAREVLAPLATPSSSNAGDLKLGAKIAQLLADYPQAEKLYTRLVAISTADSKDRIEAVEGLVHVYYQTNQYGKANGLTLPPASEDAAELLTFMQRFEGQPYRIEWARPDKVAHLPIINDFAPPGALPVMKLEINGHPVEFILDTGGDRLYIDEGVAAKIGIRNIAHRKSRYAYTKGEIVEEPLGVAGTVKLGDVTLSNVPVIVAKWKALGIESDGVVTTQILKQFLSTVDYRNKRLTFRERSESGHRQYLDSLQGAAPVSIPFYMADTHLMFAKGSLNGHKNLNIFMDSGLAASVPLVIVDETIALLGLDKNPVPDQPFFISSIQSHGIGNLVRGPTQALSNVFVEKGMHWRNGFAVDALISHQYLMHLGSWTIDFDRMTYHFPEQASTAPSS